MRVKKINDKRVRKFTFTTILFSNLKCQNSNILGFRVRLPLTEYLFPLQSRVTESTTTCLSL